MEMRCHQVTIGSVEETVTIAPLLKRLRSDGVPMRPLRVMHPAPPLGPDEAAGIAELCLLAGFEGAVDIMTPRTFASRGGGMS